VKKKDISAEQTKQVETLAGFGLKDDQIANVVGLAEATLQRRCREQLKRGRSRASAAVAQTAYRLATSGTCPAMTMFWMKCRAGWREADKMDVRVGPPAQGAVTLTIAAAPLTP